MPLELFANNLIYICQQVIETGGLPVLCTINPVIEGNEEEYYYSRHPRDWYAGT